MARARTATAEVLVGVVPAEVSQAPEMVRSSAVTTEVNGTVSYNVLDDYISPTGDDLYLAAATGSSTDVVSFRPDGTITYRNTGTGAGTDTSVEFVISDGVEQTAGRLTVAIAPADSTTPGGVSVLRHRGGRHRGHRQPAAPSGHRGGPTGDDQHRPARAGQRGGHGPTRSGDRDGCCHGHHCRQLLLHLRGGNGWPRRHRGAASGFPRTERLGQSRGPDDGHRLSGPRRPDRSRPARQRHRSRRSGAGGPRGRSPRRVPGHCGRRRPAPGPGLRAPHPARHRGVRLFGVRRRQHPGRTDSDRSGTRSASASRPAGVPDHRNRPRR